MRRAMPIWVGRFIAVPLLGVIGGVVVGAIGFAPIATAVDPLSSGAFHSKVGAAYQRIGVIFGIPIGALAGLLVVSVWWLVGRSKRLPTTAPDHACGKLSGMPRFSIKDLTLATAMMAIGIGLVTYVLRYKPESVNSITNVSSLFPLSWFGGGVLIGAGIMTPFNRPWTGVIIGIVCTAALAPFVLTVAVVG